MVFPFTKIPPDAVRLHSDDGTGGSIAIFDSLSIGSPAFAFLIASILVFFAPATADAKLGPLQVRFLPPKGVTQTQAPSAADAIDAVVKKIQTNDSGSDGYLNSFDACRMSTPALAGEACSIATADILVTTAFGPKDAAGDYPVTMVGGAVTDFHPTGHISFSVSATDVAAWPKVFLNQDLTQLLGSPSLSNGELALSGFSPFLQLVPESATDRKYIGTLAHYLAAERIETVPSQFTGIDATPGNTSASTICQMNPRYLYFSVDMRQQTQPLEFRTIITASATGKIIDCANPGNPIAFHDEERANLATTKTSFASLIGILALAFVSKTNSWGNTGSVATSLAGFVDVDPSSSVVEQALYDKAMSGLVADMCKAIDAAATTTVAQRSPVPAQSPSPAVNVLASSQISAPAAAGGTTNSLGVGDLRVPTQPLLTCADHR